MADSSKKARSDRIAPSNRPANTPPTDPPPIPDPLGDGEHVVPSGRLTSGSPDHAGLLGSGSEPLPDGGVDQHPIHDEDLEDLGPEEYEALADAAETGFLQDEDEEQPEEETEEEGEEIERSR
jgi:hypothetical protein